MAIDENGNDLTDELSNSTVLALEPTFRTTLAVAEIEAMLSQPTDWDDVNSTYPESTADVDFLEATDYMGAVDPVLDDDIAPWWSQWTVNCTLGSNRFYQQPNGWDDRWACQGSGISDPRDRDSDNDGLNDFYDALPNDRSELFDTDLDGIGNNRDLDDDGDGVADGNDVPLDATETVDSDGDGVGDNSDAFPNDPNEWADSDGDGSGDNADVDADGDGFVDCIVNITRIQDGLCQLPVRFGQTWPDLL